MRTKTIISPPAPTSPESAESARSVHPTSVVSSAIHFITYYFMSSNHGIGRQVEKHCGVFLPEVAEMTEPKWWDCTLTREETLHSGALNPWAEISTEELGNWLLSHGVERCVIGEEVGADGYSHWQMRMVFHKPTSSTTVFALIAQGHWTPTQVRNFDYCEKEGKYWRSWEGALRKYQTLELYPWQNEVIERLKQQNDRKVMVLIDYIGSSGKTTLAKTITARHIGAYCPAMDESKDYMAWALAHQTARIFVLDIPKSDSRKKNADLWSAVLHLLHG
uniref:Replication associated protein n=1 Tax=Cressdnaviricota sp. TaxID=2748378 RepID=A0A8E7YZB3_9VIRU|nr:replication associated protein [Cressdnaviricota sp.]